MTGYDILAIFAIALAVVSIMLALIAVGMLAAAERRRTQNRRVTGNDHVHEILFGSSLEDER